MASIFNCSLVACDQNNLNKMEPVYMEMARQDLLEFGINDLFNVVAFSVMSAVGMILNTMVLITAHRKSGIGEIRLAPTLLYHTNIHYLVFHLTVADTLVSYITMPLEAAWRFTLQWEADNISCKVLMVLRAFGYYLSSAMLVMICIDRLLVVTNPMVTLQSGKQRRVARLMVLFSWVVSFVLSSPQALMFRKMKHPHLEFYQCTTNMVIENYSTVVMDGDKASYFFFGIDSDTIYMIYHLSFLIFVYFLPLCCLLVSYIFIIILIRRRPTGQLVPSLDSNPLVRSLSQTRRKWKNLSISLVQLAGFALCWAPYACHQAWMLLHEKSAMQMSEFATDLMLLTAVFNSCFNPLVYGGHFYKDVRTLGRQRVSMRLSKTRSWRERLPHTTEMTTAHCTMSQLVGYSQ